MKIESKNTKMKSMKRQMENKNYCFYFYFQVRESPAPLNRPTPTPAPWPLRPGRGLVSLENYRLTLSNKHVVVGDYIIISDLIKENMINIAIYTNV